MRAWQRTARFYELTQRVARFSLDPATLTHAESAAALEAQQTLDEALGTGRLPFHLTLYRGIRSTRLTLGVDHPVDAVGQVLRERGYLATSVVREVAVNEFTSSAGALLEVDVPAGTPALWVAALGSPRLRRQGELLLPSHVRLRIYAYQQQPDLAILSVGVTS